MIAYSPFGSPDLPWGEKMPHILADPVLTRIAAKYKRSTANVALRWLLQRGLATIPKVVIRRIILEFQLGSSQMVIATWIGNHSYYVLTKIWIL